jgi:Ca2+-binding RTX toxin-like protein
MTVGFTPGHYDSEPGFPPVGSLFWQIENVIGSAFDDYLYGDEKNNRVLGFEGDDDLYGRGGDDYLAGGDGYDYLNGGDGSDACWEWEIAGVGCES